MQGFLCSGGAEAWFQYAELLAEGRGVTRSDAAAVLLLRRAAEATTLRNTPQHYLNYPKEAVLWRK